MSSYAKIRGRGLSDPGSEGLVRPSAEARNDPSHPVDWDRTNGECDVVFEMMLPQSGSRLACHERPTPERRPADTCFPSRLYRKTIVDAG
jgi:hypothetical protein